MGRIYRDSTVAISAMVSKGSRCGIFNSSTGATSHASLDVSVPVSADDASDQRCASLKRVDFSEGSLFRLYTSGGRSDVKVDHNALTDEQYL